MGLTVPGVSALLRWPSSPGSNLISETAVTDDAYPSWNGDTDEDKVNRMVLWNIHNIENHFFLVIMCIHAVTYGVSQSSTDPTFFELFSPPSPMLIHRQTDIVFSRLEPLSKRNKTILKAQCEKSKTEGKKKVLKIGSFNYNNQNIYHLSVAIRIW